MLSMLSAVGEVVAIDLRRCCVVSCMIAMSMALSMVGASPSVRSFSLISCDFIPETILSLTISSGLS